MKIWYSDYLVSIILGEKTIFFLFSWYSYFDTNFSIYIKKTSIIIILYFAELGMKEIEINSGVIEYKLADKAHGFLFIKASRRKLQIVSMALG